MPLAHMEASKVIHLQILWGLSGMHREANIQFLSGELSYIEKNILFDYFL